MAGTLTIAAVLAMTVSCSKDQISVPVDSTQESAPQTIFVSVGADINDGPQTKSAVYYDSENKQRILQFTEGDRLYVSGDVSDYYTTAEDGTDYCEYIVAGYLTLDPTTLSADGRKGTFSGDLSVYRARVEVDEQDEWVIDEYEWEEEVLEWDEDLQEDVIVDYIIHPEEGHYETVRYVEIDYPDQNIVTNLDGIFNDTSDPLSECSNTLAILVHRDAGSLFDVDDWKWGWLDDFVAPDVETLMTRALSVYGMYRSSTKDFSLFLSEYDDQSILNCSIDGLTPDARYTIEYLYDESNAFSGYTMREMEDTITADNSGHASFAFFGKNYHERDWGRTLYHALRLKNPDDEYDVKIVDIGGPKRLTNKVYNISRTATDDPFARIRPLKPTLTRSDGLDASELVNVINEDEYHFHGTYDDGTGEYAQDIVLGISGNSGAYRYSLYNGGIVTLGGNGIARYAYGSCLFSMGDVTIMLDSDYTIQTPSNPYAISSYEGEIKLGSVSGSHTLTLITNDVDYKGFSSYYYPTKWDNEQGCTVEQPASALAASGCSVELTSSTDNGNGTYTFVYTVTKL